MAVSIFKIDAKAPEKCQEEISLVFRVALATIN